MRTLKVSRKLYTSCRFNTQTLQSTPASCQFSSFCFIYGSNQITYLSIIQKSLFLNALYLQPISFKMIPTFCKMQYLPFHNKNLAHLISYIYSLNLLTYQLHQLPPLQVSREVISIMQMDLTVCSYIQKQSLRGIL